MQYAEDNLDSWSCCFTFDIPGYRDSTNQESMIEVENYSDAELFIDEHGDLGNNYFDPEVNALANVRNQLIEGDDTRYDYVDEIYYTDAND